MAVSAPQPFGSHTDRNVTIEIDVDSSVAVLAVHGTWTPALSHSTSTGLRKCFAEHPDGLIVDLADLHDEPTASAATWVTAQRAAARMQPPVQMAMCVPAMLPLADRLQRLGARRFLPVFATVRQARVALAGRRPLTDRVVRTLPAEPDSPALARDLVGQACQAWGLPDLLRPARLLMSELVTNAVEHAVTDITVALYRRSTGLHMSVSDDNPAPPRLLDLSSPAPGRPLDERGRGMHAVNTMATAWGSAATATGKVVWAALTPPPGAYRP